MQKISEWIYRKLNMKGILPTVDLRNRICGLKTMNRQEQEEEIRFFCVSQIRKVLITLSVTLGLAILLFIYYLLTGGGIRVNRAGYGEEETVYSIQYVDGTNGKKSVDISVPAVMYSKEELDAEFTRAFSYIEEVMLGDNSSFDHITTDLNLVRDVPDSGLSVSWEISDYTYLTETGKVLNETLRRPEEVLLTLNLTYESREESRNYRINICPRNLTAEESEAQSLREQIEAYIGKSPYLSTVSLPERFGNKRLVSEPVYAGGCKVLLFGLVIALLLLLKGREDLSAKRKRQQEEFLCLFPTVVNRLLLYLEAGATVDGALRSLTERYEKSGQTNLRIYRELCVMWNEMDTGVSREEAYFGFSRRIGLLPYRKLMSLLNQETKHGGSKILLQLREEEQLAYAQRKDTARRKGEEAGTKLLFPMILLMGLSMLLIMVPAFLSFQF